MNPLLVKEKRIKEKTDVMLQMYLQSVYDTIPTVDATCRLIQGLTG